MKLSPMTATLEPTYPTRCRASTSWRRIAAAAAVGVSLLLPACGDDATVAVPGAEQPIEVVVPIEEQKPPEPVVEPPEPNSPDPPPVRYGGIARSPEL